MEADTPVLKSFEDNENELSAVEEKELKNCFQKWFTIIHKCRKCRDEYFVKIK
jgi:hypothetical protein